MRYHPRLKKYRQAQNARRKSYSQYSHVQAIETHILRGMELLQIKEEFYKYGHEEHATIKEYFNGKKPLGANHSHASNLMRIATFPMIAIEISNRLDTLSIAKIAKELPKLRQVD